VTSTGEDIYIMRKDGTNLHQVTNTAGKDEEFGERGVPLREPSVGLRPLNRMHDPGVPTRADAAAEAGTVSSYSGAVLVESDTGIVPWRARKQLLLERIAYTRAPADIAQW
jgi:hypothetical protein